MKMQKRSVPLQDWTSSDLSPGDNAMGKTLEEMPLKTKIRFQKFKSKH
jgi:hypothetical protein